MYLKLLSVYTDAVSATSTINLLFGSGIMSSSTHIILNDEMDDFSTPNTTNSYGIAASEVNFITPLKRPQSSMTPIIVTDKNNNVRLVLGASGGPRIISGVAYVSSFYLSVWNINELFILCQICTVGQKSTVINISIYVSGYV